MYLEERVEALENEREELLQRIEYLENRGTDRFVTVAELAKLFECSTNTIYVKIREGEIYATRKTGNARIPMSQFYPEPKITRMTQKTQKEAKTLSLKEKVFG